MLVDEVPTRSPARALEKCREYYASSTTIGSGLVHGHARGVHPMNCGYPHDPPREATFLASYPGDEHEDAFVDEPVCNTCAGWCSEHGSTLRPVEQRDAS